MQHGIYMCNKLKELKTKNFSIIVPVYNEEKFINKSIRKIIYHANNTNLDYDIIIIDDGSLDNTWNCIKELKKEFPFIKGIRFTRNFGKEAAIYAGLKETSKMAAIVIDADLEHPPELIEDMIRIWLNKNTNIVEAIKIKRSYDNKIRLFLTKLFLTIFYKATGIDIENETDYKLLDRYVINLYLEMPERLRFFRGLIKWTGFKSEKVYFIPPKQTNRNSRWSFSRLVSFAWDALFSFTTLPIKAILFIGFIVLITSFILGAHTIYMKISHKALTGFPTVILLELFSLSIFMISIGIIGEYIGKIYQEIKRRPIYVIEEKL